MQHAVLFFLQRWQLTFKQVNDTVQRDVQRLGSSIWFHNEVAVRIYTTALRTSGARAVDR